MKFPRKVYAIKHDVTNRVYVGSSGDPETRFKNHMYALKNHKHIVEDMQADFDKYGGDYSFTILDEIDSCEESHKEYDWMEKYSSYKRGVGYNYNDRYVAHYLKREEGTPLIKNPPKCEVQDHALNGLTENEKEMISIIRNSKNLTLTLMKTFAAICLFLAAEEQAKALMNIME